MLRHVTHARDAFEYFLLLAIVHLCDRVFLMMEWVYQWKPFWILVGDTFLKAYFEERQSVDDGSIRDPGENSTKTAPCAADSMRRNEGQRTATVPSSTSNLGTPHRHRNPHGKQLEHLMLPRGNSPELRVLQPSGKNRRHHCPPLPKRVCNFIHPKQLSPFPERLGLPFPEEEILSGYEEDVSCHLRPFCCVGESRPSHYLRTTCGRRSKGPRGMS